MIDPGLDSDQLLEALKVSRLQPKAVLSTHGHFDHIGSAKNIQDEFAVPYFLHEADFKMSQSANFFLKVAGINHTILTPKPDVFLKGSFQNVSIGNFHIEVYHLPGHSNGSCVFKWKNYLLTGDLVYKSGMGPESIPKEDKQMLRSSLKELFRLFSDDTLVLPGHGQAETLGNIKSKNLPLKTFIETTNNATS